jgi:acetyl-CoA carboxylase biotin carboxyl carrier protein
MDVKELRRLLRLMRDFELTELEIEEEGHRVRLRRGAEGLVAPAGPVAPTPSPAPSPAPEPAPATPRDLAAEGLVEIPSPMVGTFYRAPSPDAEPFVQVGDAVGPESTVCIIEAMKVMNEIQAEIQGEIREILVNNAEAVEFGQPLFLVRPAGG